MSGHFIIIVVVVFTFLFTCANVVIGLVVIVTFTVHCALLTLSTELPWTPTLTHPCSNISKTMCPCVQQQQAWSDTGPASNGILTGTGCQLTQLIQPRTTLFILTSGSSVFFSHCRLKMFFSSCWLLLLLFFPITIGIGVKNNTNTHLLFDFALFKLSSIS